MGSNTFKRPSGMLGLTIVLVGQAISILASSMTGFALSIWVFQKTSSATSLGIMQTAFILSYLLIIPLAGVMVDRYNRKLWNRPCARRVGWPPPSVGWWDQALAPAWR